MAKKPKAAPKKTVNVDAVKREVKKMIKHHDPKPSGPAKFGNGMGEVAPGSVSRESPLEQKMGSKYKKMIHDHNEKNKHILDRLPFTFPKKKLIRSHMDVHLECPTEDCDNTFWGSEHTVGVVCKKCGKYVHPRNTEAEIRGYDPEVKAGIFGDANDLLDAREKARKKS